MYGNSIIQAERCLPICGVLSRACLRTFSRSLIPTMRIGVEKRSTNFRQSSEKVLQEGNLCYSLSPLLSISRTGFHRELGHRNGRLGDYLERKYSRMSNNHKNNLKLGVSAGLISLILYILSSAREKNNGRDAKDLRPGFGSNMASKYIVNMINDPNIEDSLKKLFKRVLTSLVKDDDFSKDWRQGIRQLIKECEEEIGQNLTDVLKTKIVQDWLYSTTNEIVDYMSRTPDIISKTSSLFSEAFNHQIFTDNSKKWLEELIQNCVINNKKIIHSINHLLIKIFNTRDIQNNLSDLFRDVILNDSTQDYISLAFWNVVRKSLIFPKNWFNGIKSTENSIKNQRKKP